MTAWNYGIVWNSIVLCAVHLTSGEDWFSQGQRLLGERLGQQMNQDVARNVILFVGDGMGISTVTASRIYQGQKLGNPGEENLLSFEKFPHVGLAKPYSVDHQVPDSASTATALLTGVKTRYGVVGAGPGAKPMDCGSLAGSELEGLLDWSKQQGKWTGVVTTSRLTDATPAAAYAHSPWRFWEIDSDLPPGVSGTCQDIALQLVTASPDIRVLMGGGRAYFTPNTTTADPEYPDLTGIRGDGRNLIEEWVKDKRDRGATYRYVWNETDFQSVNPGETDFLLGMFEPDHMQYELDRKFDQSGEPHLADMTEKAIKILERNKNGYFLLVEGSRIDHAHHVGNAKRALEDTVALAAAVERALALVDSADTLVVVTADHSHTLTIGGYPSRGNDILGVLDPAALKVFSPTDGLPLTTLLYANGHGPTDRRHAIGTDTAGNDYQQAVAVRTSYGSHSGEDVPVYARGPQAHLLAGVYEQHYVAHALAYASCVGPGRQRCDRNDGNSAREQLASAAAASEALAREGCVTPSGAAKLRENNVFNVFLCLVVVVVNILFCIESR